MHRLSICTLIGLVGVVVSAHAALLPETVSLLPNGEGLVIGETAAGRVSVRDFSGKVLRSLEPTRPEGGFLGVAASQATMPVTGAVAASDGTLYATTENGNEGRLYREDKWVVTGNRPMSPILSADEKVLFLCNRFDGTVQKYDAHSLELLAEAKAVREPIGCALGADGKLLFVANLLPLEATEPVQHVAARVTLIEVESFKVLTNVLLPDGSTGVRGITASPNGEHIYLTHTQARYQLPTTQLERGWMNTAALSVFNGKSGAYINTVLLDDVDRGAANPWGVSVSPDGTRIVVAHAGTREISVIDRKALHQRLADAAAGKKVTEVTSSADTVHNDLSFLSGIRKRYTFPAQGPRGVVATDSEAYTVCFFADALVEIPFAKRVVRPVVRPLDGDKLLDLSASPELRGEMLFNDGSKCFQQWQSCASCHPDGIIDGLNWDLLNDGIGNPKQSKSLYLSGITPPTMITGIRRDMQHCNRAGFRHIQFTTVTEEEAKCIDAYVMAMRQQVSPYARAKNAEAIARGKVIFEDPAKADCAACHKQEYAFTAAVDPNDATKTPLYDVGLGTRDMMGRKFDVPTLREVWRTAPYLYDGRARTMREVLTTWNPADQHGVTSELSEAELNDLELYILSL